MSLTKKIIAVYRNNQFFAEGDNVYVSELLGLHESWITRKAAEGGKIVKPDGEYVLCYTGARKPKPKEESKRKPKLSIAEINRRAREAGMHYGDYVALHGIK